MLIRAYKLQLSEQKMHAKNNNIYEYGKGFKFMQINLHQTEVKNISN